MHEVISSTLIVSTKPLVFTGGFFIIMIEIKSALEHICSSVLFIIRIWLPFAAAPPRLSVYRPERGRDDQSEEGNRLSEPGNRLPRK